MYRQRSIRVLMGLLAIIAGCTKDDVRAEAEAETGSTDATDAGADPTTDEPDDESEDGTESGTEDETGDEGGPQWNPVLDGDELAVEPEPVYRPTQGRWPAVAFDGNQYFAVWEDHRMRRPSLYGGRVAADGTALDPFGISILDFPAPGPDDYAPFEYVPAVASDGLDFLVVASKEGQLLGVRVSAAGELLDPGGFLIAEPGYELVVPSLVFDGAQYLVAWGDEGIYTARVQSDGTVLDPGGVLAYEMDESTSVALSFDGANTLLSWQDYDVQLQSEVLMAGRMAPDGTLLDQTPILIETIEENWFYYTPQPAAGFDGTNHVLAWLESGENEEGWEEYRVLATRVTPNGGVLDPDGIPIFAESIETTDVHRLVVAADDGRSQIVWSLDYGGEGPGAANVRAARLAADGTASVYPWDTFPRGLEATATVHPDGALLLWRAGDDPSADYPAITGTLLDGADVPVPDSVVVPASPASRQDVRAVASDGKNYFVLWLDTREPMAEGRALYGARLGPSGELLDAEPILLHDRRTDLADVVFDGANYVVTWMWDTGGEGSGTPFETVRVSPAGEVLDKASIESGLKANNAILAGASDGTHTLLVGADNHYHPNMDIELAAVLLDQSGALASDIIPILVNTSSPSLQASVSFESGYLVVWSDYSWFAPSEEGILGQRITQAGELEGDIFTIVDNDAWVWHVASAVGGGHHLIVWQEDSGIWATRVSPGGQVLDPDGILVVSSELGPDRCERDPERDIGACMSVEFDGQNFVIAWRAPSMLGDWSSLDLYAVLLSPDGEVSSQIELSQGPERAGVPFLAAADDGRVLAVYSRFMPGPPHDTRRAMAQFLVH